jgi:hypothetical protein
MDTWEGYLFLFRSKSGQYIDLHDTLDLTLEFIMKPEELLNIASHGLGNQLTIPSKRLFPSLAPHQISARGSNDLTWIGNFWAPLVNWVQSGVHVPHTTGRLH